MPMRDSSRAITLDQLTHRLETLTKRHTGHRGPAVNVAANQLRAYRAGYPTTALGGGGTSSSTEDRTSRTALAPDPHRRALDSLDAALLTALRALDLAARITQANLPHHGIPTPTGEVDADAWCASCARLEDHRGLPWMEPTHRTTTRAGGKPTPLCRWCYRYALANRALPPIQLLRAFRIDGKRITEAMVAQASRSA